MLQRLIKYIYEGVMLLLVMITIITIWTESSYDSMIHWIVWFIFCVDFFARLIMSHSKWLFIKQNPFLLIAIIPFDQFFQIARIVRVIYLFRIKSITKYYVLPLVKTWTSASWILLVSLVLLFSGSSTYFLWKQEAAITTYVDSLLALGGHFIFFGHKLFDIEHPVSIWLLTFTSILGVICQGLALQWLFNKFDPIMQRLKAKQSKLLNTNFFK